MTWAMQMTVLDCALANLAAATLKESEDPEAWRGIAFDSKLMVDAIRTRHPDLWSQYYVEYGPWLPT